MISVGNNIPVQPQQFQTRVDMEMPDVSNQPGAFTKGGPSLEVSISPQARAMMTLDTQSLASKGYSSVNIDTDGKPGAEISVDLTSGTAPAQVLVTSNSTAADPAGLASSLFGKDMEDSDDALAFLLDVIETLAKELAEQTGENPLDTLLSAMKETAQSGSDEDKAAMISVAIAAGKSVVDALNGGSSGAANASQLPAAA